jgi:hypothetical protein
VFKYHVDWFVETNILEKCAFSIFRADVMSLDSEGLYRVAGEEV